MQMLPVNVCVCIGISRRPRVFPWSGWGCEVRVQGQRSRRGHQLEGRQWRAWTTSVNYEQYIKSSSLPIIGHLLHVQLLLLIMMRMRLLLYSFSVLLLLINVFYFVIFIIISPVWARGNPSLSSHFPTFFSVFYIFSLFYSCFIYLLAFHPFQFYQNSCTPFPRPDVVGVGGDWTWL